MAEVMKFEDLKKLGSESAVKAAGRYLQKGKDYKVEDGDVIYFKVRLIMKWTVIRYVSLSIDRFCRPLNTSPNILYFNQTV
jgi:hypothetical protein